MILESIKIKNININFLNNPKIKFLNLENYLNFDQLIAVTNIFGNFLVVSGPGSGKTRVIIFRTLALITFGVPPENILLITFTNKSSFELKDRINNFLPNSTVRIETFHSLAYKYLKTFSTNKNFSILTQEETVNIIFSTPNFNLIKKKISKELILNFIFTFKYNIKIFNENIKILNSKEKNILIESLNLFFQIKKERNALTFHDLIFNFINLLKTKDIPLNFSHIMVDEFQDIDPLQVELLRLLKCNNIFAVGDECQSIYSFRGASLENIFNFPYLFKNSRTIFLKENFRSSKELVDFSNAIEKNFKLSLNKNIFSKITLSIKPEIRVYKTFQDELLGISEKITSLLKDEPEASIAILFRNNFSINLFKGSLPKNITLMTIHKAKGLEWDYVFLPTLLQGILPSLYNQDLEEEKRVFYVGVTRAKKNLFLSYPLSFYSPQGFFQEPSCFFNIFSCDLYNIKRG